MTLDQLILVLGLAALIRRPQVGLLLGLCGAAALNPADLLHGVLKAAPASFLVTWATPLLATVAAGMAVERLVGEARPDQVDAPQHGVRLLVLVNVLNVADALLTWVLLARGTGEELNPIVDAITLPGKVALVAIGSWLVYRWKPRWLVVPVGALALVIAYHLGGWLTAGG